MVYVYHVQGRDCCMRNKCTFTFGVKVFQKTCSFLSLVLVIAVLYCSAKIKCKKALNNILISRVLAFQIFSWELAVVQFAQVKVSISDSFFIKQAHKKHYVFNYFVCFKLCCTTKQIKVSTTSSSFSTCHSKVSCCPKSLRCVYCLVSNMQ